jgi:D-alanine-D-alanine ligase
MIAILTGGIGDEAEISRRSAANIREIVEQSGYEVLTFDFPDDLETFLDGRHEIECAIPAIHGKWGEDGSLQGFLDLLGIPYLFSDARASALAIDKQKTKTVLAAFGMPTADATIVKPGDAWPEWSHPVVVKPIDSGSSYHTLICRDNPSYDGFKDSHSDNRTTWLIEDFRPGDEYTVGIVESVGRAIALPVIAIKPKTEFFDLEAKYDPTLCEEICPALISESLADELKRLALLAHMKLGLRHISRSDFIVGTDGVITFLETNTIPGFTSASLMPKALATAKIPPKDIFTNWIIEIKS